MLIKIVKKEVLKIKETLSIWNYICIKRKYFSFFRTFRRLLFYENDFQQHFLIMRYLFVEGMFNGN